MTLDSIGQFPMAMTDNHHQHHHHWYRSEPELNSFLPANQSSPPTGGFVSRPSSSSSSSRKLATVKSRKLSHGGSRPNYAVVARGGWETNGFDRETTRQFVPVEQYGHATTVERPSQQRRTDHPMHAWTTPVGGGGGGYPDNDRLRQAVRLRALMLDAVDGRAGEGGRDVDGLSSSSSSASSLAPFVRERTRSTGSWKYVGGGERFSSSMTEEFPSAATAARVGLIAYKNGGGADDYFVCGGRAPTVSDVSLETMRRNLVNLWASKGDDAHGPWTPEVVVGPDELLAATRSSSFSCGSSSSRWRHSGGLEPDGHLQLRLQVRQRYDDLPVDVTSRKRRLKTAAAVVVDKTSPRAAAAKTVSQGATPDPPISDPDDDNNSSSSNRVQDLSGQKRTGVDDDDDFAEPSILRSMLTERGRCYSMSVIEMRRQRRRLGAHLGCHRHSGAAADGVVNSSAAAATAALNLTSGAPPPPPPSDRQLVTLAKKNLLPVTARITDLLGKTVDFAKSIPQFRRLSLADREALLASSCLRLLLLAMAEVNLQFATTIVAAAAAAAAASDTAPSSGGVGGGGGEEGCHQVDAKSRRGDRRPSEEASRVPTTHFVNSIQNFIRKCQMLDITSEEYVQMKTITLFQSGIGSVDCTLASNGVNSSSRQQLQDIVNRCHPNEKLRYSSLLLSLHTLYGVHGGMMRSLFCRHLDKSGGISTFINNSLSTTS